MIHDNIPYCSERRDPPIGGKPTLPPQPKEKVEPSVRLFLFTWLSGGKNLAVRVRCCSLLEAGYIIVSTMKQVVIIHGGSDWRTREEYLEYLRTVPVEPKDFQLKDKWRNKMSTWLGADFEVFNPEMPCMDNAHHEEWKIWFERLLPFLNDGVVLIGHSLGGIFLAKYLSEEDVRVKIAAAVLISAPFDDDGLEPPLGDFSLDARLDKMAAHVGKIYILHSRDDGVVPYSHAEKYHKALPGSELICLDGLGHCTGPDFPELVEIVRSL